MDVVTSGRTKPVDIVIITVRDDEHRAVLARIPDKEPYPRRNRIYSLASLHRQDGKALSVAVVKIAEQGNTASQTAAQDAIEDLRPGWIFLVGIAGAVPDPEIALGDVILATRLHAFTIGAATESGRFEYADQGGPMSRRVEKLVASLADFEPLLVGWETEEAISVPRPTVDESAVYGNLMWKTKVLNALRFSTQRTVARAHGRAMASSPFVVKNAKVLAEWRRSARDVSAVEMELSGVYAAARRREPGYPVLAIRGISDIVGLERDSAWTNYACNAAASFCLALLSNVPAAYLEAVPGHHKARKVPAPSRTARSHVSGTRLRAHVNTTPTLERGLVGSRTVASCTSRAWAMLDTQVGRWQFRPDKSGKVSQLVIGGGDVARVPDDEGASLAMSPDGSLLATVVGMTLRISTVDRAGTVHLWKEFDFDPDEEKPDVQVRAVAQKGDMEVWCAVAYGDRTRFASLSRSTRPVWQEASKAKAAQYAAFYGSRLMLVTLEGSDDAHPRCKCWQVSLGHQADATEWAPIGRDHRTVTAIDAVKVSGRTYLCLLAGVADGHEAETTSTHLLVLPAGSGECLVELLDSIQDHLSAVRQAEGDPDTLCILVGKKGEDRAGEHRLFLRPGAST